MKKIITVLTIGLLSFTGFSNSTAFNREAGSAERMTKGETSGIEFFQGTWNEAMANSDKKDKLIFLDAYAAWCGPCKLMAKNTFTEEAVGSFFNENFINVKMDMEKHAEGPRLSRKFELTAYPSLYFIDKNEKVVHFGLGYHKPNQIIALGKAALAK